MPGSEGIWGPVWSPNGRYISANSPKMDKLMIFDFSTQKWEVSAQLNAAFMTWSSDSEALYFDTMLEKEPAFYRLRMSDRKLEQVVSLKNIRRVRGWAGPWSGLTPDNSPWCCATLAAWISTPSTGKHPNAHSPLFDPHRHRFLQRNEPIRRTGGQPAFPTMSTTDQRGEGAPPTDSPL